MSARAVKDREAVLRAIEEWRALGRARFAELHGAPPTTPEELDESHRLGRQEVQRRYGLGGQHGYDVIHEGRGYGSTAIVAIAHREQHGRLLGPHETKGARKVLEGLGFEVVARTPSWTEDEMVLGLETYMRRRGQWPSKTHPDVIELSAMLRGLAAIQGRKHGEEFRNPEGVAQQLGKFLALDPDSTLQGRGEPSKLHHTIWERYAYDPVAREQRAREARRALEGSPSRGTLASEPLLPRALDAPRSRAKVSREQLSSPFDAEPEPLLPEPAEPHRPDPAALLRANEEHRRLRLELAERLRQSGFTCRNPPRGRGDLRYDLLATRQHLTLLVEVKSLPPDGSDHDRLRTGLGQVLWYRGRWRESCTDPCVAVLHVEREPVDVKTWLAVCFDAGVVLTWPDRFGTLVDECSIIAAPAPT